MIAGVERQHPDDGVFVARGANPSRATRTASSPAARRLGPTVWTPLNGCSSTAPCSTAKGTTGSALHYAVFQQPQCELASYCSERGADVNARSPKPLIAPDAGGARENREELTKCCSRSRRRHQGDERLGRYAAGRWRCVYEHFRLGKMISSPEEFAIAVKAPKESFGEPQRSASAPTDRSKNCCARSRNSRAEGQPSEICTSSCSPPSKPFRRNAMGYKREFPARRCPCRISRNPS